MVHFDHCHGCARSRQELASSRVDPVHEADCLSGSAACGLLSSKRRASFGSSTPS